MARTLLPQLAHLRKRGNCTIIHMPPVLMRSLQWTPGTILSIAVLADDHLLLRRLTPEQIAALYPHTEKYGQHPIIR